MLGIQAHTTSLRPPFTNSQDPFINAPESLETAPSTSTSISTGPKISTFYLDGQDRAHKPSEDLDAFIRFELDLSRLSSIHQYLWMAGRPTPARALHRQIMIGRAIVICEQTDLHLVWNGAALFIKPLPRYLLSSSFWNDHICTSPALYQAACGLLLSYIWLVRYESDLHVAKETRIFPADITWDWWVAFAAEVLDYVNPNSLGRVNRRFKYGELRLNRLNIIYRLHPVFALQHSVRGYFTGYSSYRIFFQNNFAWLLVIFAYFSIILSAMQVGLGNTLLRDDMSFQRMCYGITLLSIAVPIFALGLIITLSLFIFLINLTATLCFSLKQRRERHRWVREQPSAQGP